MTDAVRFDMFLPSSFQKSAVIAIYKAETRFSSGEALDSDVDLFWGEIRYTWIYAIDNIHSSTRLRIMMIMTTTNWLHLVTYSALQQMYS